MPEGSGILAGDKGYGSTVLIQAIEAPDMEAVIPPRSNRNEHRLADWFIYKERHLAENAS